MNGTNIRRLLSLLFILGASTNSFSHALQPGYLEIKLIEPDTYSVLWKKPAVSSKPMNISAILPDQCDQRSAKQGSQHNIWDGSAYFSYWTAICPGGLESGTIEIKGLNQTATDVLIRFDFTDGRTETRRLTPGNSSFTVPTIPSSFEVVKTYLTLGFQHILSGIDHLMFVLALLLLVKGKRRLIITVTAFTLAHSLTLAAATLGFIKLPGPPIEATIALSIMFIASEIMHSRRGVLGLTERYPWAVAFIFGLLHGLGFAGALAQVGMPETAIPTALLFFNIGVELGQLFFIASTFIVIGIIRRLTRSGNITPPPWATALPVYIIGSMAAFWVIQRLAEF